MDLLDIKEDKKRKLKRYNIPDNMDIEDSDMVKISPNDEYKNNTPEFKDVKIDDNEVGIKHYKRYRIDKKLEIIAKAELIGNRKAAALYNINESSIRYIRKHKKEYELSKYKNKLTTLHKGTSSDIYIDWEKIKLFIIDQRKYGIPVTTNLIYLEVLKQIQPFRKFKKSTIYQRIYRYLKRNNLSFYKDSNKKVLPENSLQIIDNFLKEIILNRTYNLNKPIKNNLIVNMDEIKH